MSLRDELDAMRPRPRSRVSDWLETQTPTFRNEFMDLVRDRDVNHAELCKLANKHGLDLKSSAFGEWRVQQWTSVES